VGHSQLHPVLRVLPMLVQVDLSPLSREALMCFAINLYNTLCIHTLVVHGPDRYNESVGRLQFFRKVCRPLVTVHIRQRLNATAQTGASLGSVNMHNDSVLAVGYAVTLLFACLYCGGFMCASACVCRLHATTLVGGTMCWMTLRMASCAAMHRARHLSACCSSSPGCPRGRSSRATHVHDM
jgi:hypothetical protein